MVPERNLSFFSADAATYAIPRALQHEPTAAKESALRILRRESSELVSYIYNQYNLVLESDKASGACLFPSDKRWLKGEEYAFLIRHYFAYSKLLSIYPLNEKHHPKSVYD